MLLLQGCWRESADPGRSLAPSVLLPRDRLIPKPNPRVLEDEKAPWRIQSWKLRDSEEEPAPPHRRPPGSARERKPQQRQTQEYIQNVEAIKGRPLNYCPAGPRGSEEVAWVNMWRGVRAVPRVRVIWVFGSWEMRLYSGCKYRSPCVETDKDEQQQEWGK